MQPPPPIPLVPSWLLTATAANVAAAAAAAALPLTLTSTAATHRHAIVCQSAKCGTDDQFGQALAISGDTLVVGAISEASCSTSVSTTAATDNGCSFAGAVYVFVRSGMLCGASILSQGAKCRKWRLVWVHVVAISSDTLVVGAPSEATARRA